MPTDRADTPGPASRSAMWHRSSAVEQGNHNPLVGGSNPSGATTATTLKMNINYRNEIRTRSDLSASVCALILLDFLAISHHSQFPMMRVELRLGARSGSKRLFFVICSCARKICQAGFRLSSAWNAPLVTEKSYAQCITTAPLSTRRKVSRLNLGRSAPNHNLLAGNRSVDMVVERRKDGAIMELAALVQCLQSGAQTAGI